MLTAAAGDPERPLQEPGGQPGSPDPGEVGRAALSGTERDPSPGQDVRDACGGSARLGLALPGDAPTGCLEAHLNPPALPAGACGRSADWPRGPPALLGCSWPDGRGSTGPERAQCA